MRRRRERIRLGAVAEHTASVRPAKKFSFSPAGAHWATWRLLLHDLSDENASTPSTVKICPPAVRNLLITCRTAWGHQLYSKSQLRCGSHESEVGVHMGQYLAKWCYIFPAS